MAFISFISRLQLTWYLIFPIMMVRLAMNCGWIVSTSASSGTGGWTTFDTPELGVSRFSQWTSGGNSEFTLHDNEPAWPASTHVCTGGKSGCSSGRRGTCLSISVDYKECKLRFWSCHIVACTKFRLVWGWGVCSHKNQYSRPLRIKKLCNVWYLTRSNNYIAKMLNGFQEKTNLRKRKNFDAF